MHGLSRPVDATTSVSGHNFINSGGVHVSCGHSTSTHLPCGRWTWCSPIPVFDNVHYSELADLFHVCQQHILRAPHERSTTTRHVGDVQSADPDYFAARLVESWFAVTAAHPVRSEITTAAPKRTSATRSAST